MSIEDIAQAIERRGILRLCHFTPFRNAHRIIQSRALLCSARLQSENPAAYNPTDAARIDGRTGHVCTTIEYPNAWYLDRVEAQDDVWIDYLVFQIRPEVMMRTGVEFCTSNAARARGTSCKPGITAFEKLYAQEIRGYMTYTRGPQHPAWLPTDMQAEVLVPDCITFDDVMGAVVRTRTIAKRLCAQLRAAQVELTLPLYVSGGTFDQRVLRGLRTGGRRPREQRYPE